MRFVHVVVGSADPSSLNGVNKVVHSLAEAQIAAGHAAEVWAIKPDGSPATHARSYPLTVFRATWSRLLLAPELREAIDALPPDAWVQLHSVYIPEFTPIARQLLRRGLQYGFTPHGGYLSVHFDPPRRRAKKKLFAALLENWTLRHAAMVHMIGETERADLRARAPAAKLVHIPNGYRIPQEFAGAGRREEAEPPVFVYAGRHATVQKGLDLLLHGYALYREAGGSFGLVMAGGGRDTAALQSLAGTLGIAGTVAWPGVLSGATLFGLVRGAAAFVHTSRFDVLPTGCLEAAALAVPLVVSRETNLEEYILPRNAGWICAPNTPAVIAQVMLRVERTSREQRRAMGREARRLIDEQLQWDSIARSFERAVLECRSPLPAIRRPELRAAS